MSVCVPCLEGAHLVLWIPECILLQPFQALIIRPWIKANRMATQAAHYLYVAGFRATGVIRTSALDAEEDFVRLRRSTKWTYCWYA